MTHCYLLGAGASYGYDEDLPWIQKPPLTRNLFDKGYRLGVLNPTNFPELCDSLLKFPDLDIESLEDLKDKNINIETYLGKLATKFEDRVSNNKIELQRALSQTFYFIYELFRKYQQWYQPQFDAYHRLALHYYNDPYSIITLNYDTLLEKSLAHSGLNIQYLPGSRTIQTVPIIKLHGSINWINPSIERGVFRPGLTQDDFSEITASIYSNRFDIEDMIQVPIQQVEQTPYRDLVRSGTDYDEPAIIPPFDDFKDYEKVSSYPSIWDFAAQKLKAASNVTIVGSSLREYDTRLEELLSNNLDNDVTITIASPSSGNVEERLADIISNPNIKTTYESFEEYAKSL